MFTGIVEEVGKIEKRNPDGTFLIHAPQIIGEVKVGDSVAVNGCCLTVTSIQGESFSCHAVQETLDRTDLKFLEAGAKVNLEGALRAGKPLGGHIVQGHVDGLGEVLRSGQILSIKLSDDLLKYLVMKGSICISGVSLTVMELNETSFSVALIPHTLEATTLGSLKVLDLVNIEVDILGKYVERLISWKK